MACANGSNGTAPASGKVYDEAFITLATNDVYCRGALVLAESLKRHGTTRQLVIMITPHVSKRARAALDDVFDAVELVDVLDSEDVAHLALLKRPELGITFTKIHCWTLTRYKKCVFMDADMLALRNVDELFEREELSAVPDSGWPDLFNSGLFVFRPSKETFEGLLTLAGAEGSFDGGDQGLLNTYFKSWATEDISRHLSFLYNLHVSASYTYLPAFRKFGKDTKVVHFLGPVKPWHHVYNRVTGGVQQIAGPVQGEVRHYPEFLREWWALYNERIQKYFSKEDELVRKLLQFTFYPQFLPLYHDNLFYVRQQADRSQMVWIGCEPVAELRKYFFGGYFLLIATTVLLPAPSHDTRFDYKQDIQIRYVCYKNIIQPSH